MRHNLKPNCYCAKCSVFQKNIKTFLDLFVETLSKPQWGISHSSIWLTSEKWCWYETPFLLPCITHEHWCKIFSPLFHQVHIALVMCHYCLKHLSFYNIKHLRGLIVLLRLYFTQKSGPSLPTLAPDVAFGWCYFNTHWVKDRLVLFNFIFTLTEILTLTKVLCTLNPSHTQPTIQDVNPSHLCQSPVLCTPTIHPITSIQLVCWTEK